MAVSTISLRGAAAALLMAFAATGTQAVTWDFSTLSDADRAALNADTEAWEYDSDRKSVV